jgi:hypothetical protein
MNGFNAENLQIFSFMELQSAIFFLAFTPFSRMLCAVNLAPEFNDEKLSAGNVVKGRPYSVYFIKANNGRLVFLES